MSSIAFNTQRYTPGRYLSNLEALAYFFPLALIFNPFFQLPANIRYGVMAAITVSLVVIHILKGRRIVPSNVLILAIGFLYFLAILRIQPAKDSFGEPATMTTVLQATLSLFYVMACTALFPYVDRDKIPFYCLIVLLPAGAVIGPFQLQLAATGGYNIKLDPLGDFDDTSYQQMSLVLGIIALSAFTVALQRKGLVRAILIAILVLTGYFLSFGSARGEMLAVAAGFLIILSPRIFILVLPFSWYALRFLALNFDAPVLARFRVMFTREDFGERDVLFDQAINYSTSDLVVFLFGGGHNAFQFEYNNAVGLHPHNIYLESLTSGGIVLLVLIASATAIPIAITFVKSIFSNIDVTQRYMLAMAVVILIINLKSGTIVFLVVFALFFPFYQELWRESASFLFQKVLKRRR